MQQKHVAHIFGSNSAGVPSATTSSREVTPVYCNDNKHTHRTNLVNTTRLSGKNRSAYIGNDSTNAFHNFMNSFSLPGDTRKSIQIYSQTHQQSKNVARSQEKEKEEVQNVRLVFAREQTDTHTDRQVGSCTTH